MLWVEIRDTVTSPATNE